MKVLIIRLSSLGDIVQTLPVLTELREHWPEAEFDWLAEEAYVPFLASHPGLSRVMASPFRRWKGQPTAIMFEFPEYIDRLRVHAYDLVLDLHGMVKSALPARWVRRTTSGRLAGWGRKTAPEGFAACLYEERHETPEDHVIERARALVAAVTGMPHDRERVPDLGLKLTHPTPDRTRAQGGKRANQVPTNGVWLFHQTANEKKCWPQEYWVQVGLAVSKLGLSPMLPWSSKAEQRRAQEIAEAIHIEGGQATVADIIPLENWPFTLSQAMATVGIDTGLTHLSALMGRPTVQIYVASPRTWTEARWGGPQAALGGDMRSPPTVPEVLAALEDILSPSKA